MTLMKAGVVLLLYSGGTTQPSQVSLFGHIIEMTWTKNFIELNL